MNKIILIFLFLIPASILTNDGSLDGSFGTEGIVTTSISSGADNAYNVVLQPDGKIVAVGYASETPDTFALVRYNSNGSLDTTFGSGGKVTTLIGPSSNHAFKALLQQDGKIIAVGYANNGSNNDFALVRYNPDGSLDTTFGSGGKVVTSISSGNDSAFGALLQSDGKIVAVGYTTGVTFDFALARYNPDGSLDTTFGSSGTGIIITSIGSGSDNAYGAILQPDGKIIATGPSNNGSNDDFALVRYNPDGSLDTTFGPSGTGIVTTSIGNANDTAFTVLLQPNGKILAAGWANNGSNDDFALVRYNSNGSLDTTFGPSGTGIVTTSIGNANDRIFAELLQPDSKIIAVGWTSNGVSTDFALVRYNPDGSLDTTFGPSGTGIITTAIGSGTDNAYGVVLQADGKIVISGQSDIGSNYVFALVRYLIPSLTISSLARDMMAKYALIQ